MAFNLKETPANIFLWNSFYWLEVKPAIQTLIGRSKKVEVKDKFYFDGTKRKYTFFKLIFPDQKFSEIYFQKNNEVTVRIYDQSGNLLEKGGSGYETKILATIKQYAAEKDKLTP
ncbi:MAG TPA: hypothetical protein PK131_00485 [Candidatus Woesebacteria bacterium]|nr:hypothetical protein [Candidatus Woesebacteria bacterium]HRS23205.1 hypothetical protein [Candidatus Woesebacteria bacterium]HRT40137.1 hypothetical protein [Candidatus Woesebacteria bacterium]